MALIKCPDCQKEISDSAKECINCGAILQYSNTLGVFLISFLFPVIGLISYLISKATSNEEVAAASILGFMFNIILILIIILLIPSLLVGIHF